MSRRLFKEDGERRSTRKSVAPGAKAGPQRQNTALIPEEHNLQGEHLREFHPDVRDLIQNGEFGLPTPPGVGNPVPNDAGQGSGFHGGMQQQQFGRSGARAVPSMSMDSGSMGSMGSPSPGSNEAAMGRPLPNGGLGFSRQHSEKYVVEEPESPDVVGKRKKRGQGSGGGGGAEKGGKGLRHFSVKVCEKVESKGRTTYNEVADELVAEFTNPNNALASPEHAGMQQQYDEKNIRRRVYDALNVLMAMDIISKEKKEIQWKGLPSTSETNVEELTAERVRLGGLVEKKAAYLQELEDQVAGLQNLVERNERMYNVMGVRPSGGVALPFILVQTRPQATVEVEISEDMQLVHFDFNSSPFELHDDAYVLKALSLGGGGNSDRSQNGLHTDSDEGFEPSYDEPCDRVSNLYQQSSMMSPRASGPYVPGISTPAPSVPGILKARVKQEV